MGGLSASALILLLGVVTPAILPYAAFRYAFPRARTIRPTETVVIAGSSLLALVANGTLFAWFIATVVSVQEIAAPPIPYPLLVEFFADFLDAEPLRPSLSTFSIIGCDVGELNLLALLADFHLRPAIFAFGILFLSLILSRLHDLAEYLPYADERGHVLLRRLLRIPAATDGQATAAVPWPLSLVSSARERIHQAFSHPWEPITSSNRKRDLLMVDVLTQEGSLYSGKLGSWLPRGDELQAITITNTLRYYPMPESSGEVASGERGRVIIPNRGELALPAADMRTVHLWRIIRGRTFKVSVKKLAHLEVVKWVLLLADQYPDFFSKIELLMALTAQEEYQYFLDDLAAWIEERSLEVSDKIEIQEPESW